jgi:hypothetical protein
MCHFDDYRHSADLDFSAIDGLTAADAVGIVGTAVGTCRQRIEAPALEVSDSDVGTTWISYVGPLGSRPRRIKLDISDDELVESHNRLRLHRRWPDLPTGASVEVAYGIPDLVVDAGTGASPSASPQLRPEQLGLCRGPGERPAPAGGYECSVIPLRAIVKLLWPTVQVMPLLREVHVNGPPRCNCCNTS